MEYVVVGRLEMEEFDLDLDSIGGLDCGKGEVSFSFSSFYYFFLLVCRFYAVLYFRLLGRVGIGNLK